MSNRRPKRRSTSLREVLEEAIRLTLPANSLKGKKSYDFTIRRVFFIISHMTSIEFFLNQTQQVGPLHIWPMRWTGLSSLKYQVPPNIDQLFFREFDEGDGPELGRVEIFNPTAIPVLIPGGWVVGGDLLQVRVFDSSELIAPMESVLANVSCVERGRWGQGRSETDGGRAPITVHASGRSFKTHSGLWSVDEKTRQQSVWKRVATLENRSGSRPTNSLQQIMREDSTSLNIPHSLQSNSRDALKILNGQNGILIAFDGTPLLLEAYSNEEAFRMTIQSTIRAISFDIDHLRFIPTTKSEVKDFIEKASLGGLKVQRGNLFNTQLLGGGESVDTIALTDANGHLLHVTALNQRHRILQEV